MLTAAILSLVSGLWLHSDLRSTEPPASVVAQRSACADVPLELTLELDPAKVSPGAMITVEVRAVARDALRIVRATASAQGAAELVLSPELEDVSLAAFEVVTATLDVRFDADPEATITVDVEADTPGGMSFARRAVLHVLRHGGEVLTGRGHPVDLRIEALERDRLATRITAEEHALLLAELLRPDGEFDTRTAPWMVGVGPRPEAQTGPPPASVEGEGEIVPVTPSDTPGLRGGVAFRVMGNIRWTGDDGQLHPAYGVTVQVRDDDTIGSELVWTDTTDSWGNYDTGTIVHDDGVGQGAPDIFVRLRLANGVVDVRDDCFGCTTYESESAVTNEFTGGTITWNFTYAQTGTGPAASVLTALSWIATYARNLNSGAWLSSVYAHWPGDSASSNYWCGSSCRINVQPGDEFDWDVLHHEYGHKVMDDFNFDDNPGGQHNIDACHAAVRGSKDVGVRLAWGEGWPTYFGTAGQHALNLAAFGVPRVGDFDYSETAEATFSYSLEDNSGGPPWSTLNGSGEDSELAVQRVLWDLYDTAADSLDAVQESDAFLFAAFSSAHETTLSRAWQAATFGLAPARLTAWSAVLSDHNIGPAPLWPTDGDLLLPSSPVLLWSGNVGCDSSFRGNRFEIDFYHPGTLAPVLHIPWTAISGTSYTLTPTEFAALVAAGHDVLWSVTGWNTADPVTGPYRGATRLLRAYYPPINDACASATLIADGTITGTTVGSATDGNDSCAIGSGPDVWYRYEATCDGFLRADTCGSALAAVISVHDGCPGDFLNQWACNRHCPGDPCGLGHSCIGGVDVPVATGQVLLIRVAGVGSASGAFDLTVGCEARHDACDEAGPLVNGESDDGTTVGAAWDNAPVCDGVDNTAAGVWYTVIGNGNQLTASLCNAVGNYDAKLSVYCGGCGGLQCRGASDDACGVLPEVTWCSTPGAIYHVLVHGWLENEGDFRISLSNGAHCGPIYQSCAPANDDCDSATRVGPGSFTSDNTGATTDDAVTCAATSRDVWFEYQPACNGFVTITTCGAGGTLEDTVLSVHDACEGVELACNDDYPGCGVRSQVTVPVLADQPFLIRAASYGGVAQGSFPFSVSAGASIAPLALPWPGLYIAGGDGATSNYLFRVGVDGSLTPIGPLGMAGVSGLAWARPLGLLYASIDAIDADQMATVNWNTGAATAFGATGFSAVQTLAFDASAMALYGADQASGALLRIDPFTGAGRVVGAIGAGPVSGLAVDPATGALYAADSGADRLLRLNIATGAATVIGPFGGDYDDIRDIAFDALTGMLYGLQKDGANGRLVRIDTQTGAAATVAGPFSGMNPAALTVIEGLSDGTVGEPYLGALPIAGGCPRYFVGDAAGLPPGLSINAEGVIAGTPTVGGLFTVNVTVEDSDLSTPFIAAALPMRIHPAGDSCAAPRWIEEGVTPIDTRGGTTDGPAEPEACLFFGDAQVGADVWFCHRSDCAGRLTFSLCGSGYDTKLAVYESCACPAGDEAVACSDDDCGAQSILTLPVAVGQDYLIRVGGYLGATGTGALTVSCVECALDGECADDDACTADTCEGARCRHSYVNCDDQNACTLDDCQAATGCTYMAVDCDDGDPCTIDSCDPESGCVHEPGPCGGACCVGGSCVDGVSAEDCVGFVCDVRRLLPPSFAGCYGDTDGNGVVNAGDRGFITAAIGRSEPELVCLYDLDGNGVINAGDRGFVSAGVGLCTPLPDWQDGSGFNHGVPDPRFGVAFFMGAGTQCESVTCP